MSTAARKAWNEAMKATAGSVALPPALQERKQKRRSDRHKKQERRTKARKVMTGYNNNNGDDDDDIETKEYQMAVWIDVLEGVDPALEAAAQDDLDEEYDELNELDGGKAGTGTNGKKGRKKRNSITKSKAQGVLPKRFLPRTVASILIEELSREDSIAKEYIQAEGKLKKHEQLPVRKFCPVTGLIGKYKEPKIGCISYSTITALEQIRERPPPWMMISGGAAAYLDIVKSIQN